MTIEYRSGRLNAVVDALSIKVQLDALEEGEDRVECNRSQVHMTNEMQNKLCASVETDIQAKSILNHVKEGECWAWLPPKACFGA